MMRFIFWWIGIIIGSISWNTGTLIAQTATALEAYQSGRTYFNLRNYERALSFFEEAIVADQNFIDAYRSAIACYDALGRSRETLSLYQQAIERAPADKKLHYNLALTYLEIKDYDRVVLYLEKALEIDPFYTKATTQLETIQAYLQRQEVATTVVESPTPAQPHAEERQYYQNALDAYKQKDYQICLDRLAQYKGTIALPNTSYLKGIALQQLGEQAAAKEAYQQALHLAPNHLNSHLNLGRMYYNERDFVNASRHLTKAYAQRLNDHELLYALAKAYHHQPTEQTQAIQLLNEYLQYQPKNGEAWRLLGNSYSTLDQPKRAAQAYDRARQFAIVDDALSERIKQSVALYGKKASEMAKQGDYKGAIIVLERAVKEHPQEASLYFNLGLNYLEVRNMKQAQLQFTRTIELEPSHAKSYQALGLLYYEQEKYRESGTYYLAAIKAGKIDDIVYYKLGNCWFRLNRFQKAEEAYQKAIELNPQQKRYYMALGLTYLKRSEHHEAITAYKRAYELDPNCLDCRYHIAIAWFNMQELDRCIKICEEILERDDAFAKAYLLMGHCYHRRGEYGTAKDFQRQAQRLDPSLKY